MKIEHMHHLIVMKNSNVELTRAQLGGGGGV